MTRTFESVNIPEFIKFVELFDFRRKITEVHLHHTWRPTQEDYSGHRTIVGMWRHHTEKNKWSDIGQHISIGPDGSIWLCRNFNWSPASASGFNGNQQAGPFMIEMIGDFDNGRETITDAQHEATLSVIKSVQMKNDLNVTDLRFHNEMSEKSCPGTSFDKQKLIRQIKAYQLPDTTSRSAPFPDSSSRLGEMLRTMDPKETQTDDMSNTEHEAGYTNNLDDNNSRSTPLLTESTLNRLTNHALLMDHGQFHESDRFSTTKYDVDRIFGEVLPKELTAARANNKKLKLLFYAHGGLVNEKKALEIAAFQLDFWRSNNIYPIFFIWKTGFADTLKTLIFEADKNAHGGGSRSARGTFTDDLIEKFARLLNVSDVWSGMKDNARCASEPDGAANYVARKTAKFLSEHNKHVEIHTVGHSAGANFQSYFMKTLARRKATVKSAHFFAPAIRVDLFLELVSPMLGKNIEHLTMFTMNKRREKDDHVALVYRKSLLYLIYKALEKKEKTDILGLQESVERNKKLKKLFGLGGKPKKHADIVWSPSSDADTGSASDASAHGDFDEDAPTMESVARRVLDLTNGEPIKPLPDSKSRDADYWFNQFNWPIDFPDNRPNPGFDPNAGPPLPGGSTPGGNGNSIAGGDSPPDNNNTGGSSTTGNSSGSDNSSETGGRGDKKALCIGIDKYNIKPLNGCVADAVLWTQTLQNEGYVVTQLLDHHATAQGILSEISNLIENSKPSDSLVIQFSGHGTFIEDSSGDEFAGDTPLSDECLCGVDCDTSDNGLVIDDDLRLIFDRIPDGVNVTCFFDCCHSGTATKARARMAGVRGGLEKARFLEPTSRMFSAYKRRQAELVNSRTRASTVQKEVLFSACRSDELAYESNGQGDFTSVATRLIAAGVRGTSNVEFYEKVIQEFGSHRRQTPEIDCDTKARSGSFLP